MVAHPYATCRNISPTSSLRPTYKSLSGLLTTPPAIIPGAAANEGLHEADLRLVVTVLLHQHIRIVPAKPRAPEPTFMIGEHALESVNQILHSISLSLVPMSFSASLNLILAS